MKRHEKARDAVRCGLAFALLFAGYWFADFMDGLRAGVLV